MPATVHAIVGVRKRDETIEVQQSLIARDTEAGKSPGNVPHRKQGGESE